MTNTTTDLSIDFLYALRKCFDNDISTTKGVKERCNAIEDCYDMVLSLIDNLENCNTIINELKDKLLRDNLTKVYSRAAYEKYLLELASDTTSNKAFIVIDVDKFKRINDTYGHAIGDKALIEIGKFLSDYFDSENDRVFRFGGDEFIVISTNIEDQQLYIENAKKAFSSTLEMNVDENIVPLGMSAGMVLFNKYENSIIFTKADANLYRSKSLGGNQLII